MGTFVSTSLVQKLKLPTKSCEHSSYKSASGGMMLCTSFVPQLSWFVQGHTFSTDAKVLDLHCYDMIVGEDWLEKCSLMWIH